MHISADKFRLLLSVIIALLSSALYCSAAEKVSKEPVTYIIGDYGYIEEYDAGWNLLAKGKVGGLVRRYSIGDADISQDGNLLFLAVSKSDSPITIVNTKDLSINDKRSIAFPHPGFRTYFPMSLVAASSRYLYMADESYTALEKPFFNIMIDIEKGSTTKIFDQLFLTKDDIRISPRRDSMITRGWETFYYVDVPTARVVDSIKVPAEYRGKELATFDVDWDNKQIMMYRVEANKGDVISMASLNVQTKESIKIEDEKIDIENKAKKISLQSNGTRFLIEDDRNNLFVVDRGTLKVLYRVGQDKTSTVKGYGFTALLSFDSTQLIYLKHDIEKTVQNQEKEISRLTALELKTDKIVKYIEFPEKIVAVIFSVGGK